MPISYSLCMNCKAILFGKFISVPLSQLVLRFLPVFFRTVDLDRIITKTVAIVKTVINLMAHAPTFSILLKEFPALYWF